jgi:glycosyltransferase involved in cell wall biosynthesis
MNVVYCNGDMFDNVRAQDPTIQRLKDAGHEVIYYDIAKDERTKNLWFIRHFQMYEEILDLANDADFLYFSCPIGYPEAFLYELKARPNFKAKIACNMMLREVNRSYARALALKDLIDMPQFGMMVFGSMLMDIKLPSNMEKAGIDKNKIMLINEPFNEKPELFQKITKEEARKKFNIEKDEMVLLNSGAWTYAKGADLFVEVLKYIPENIKVLFHKNSAVNGPSDPTIPKGLVEEAKKNHKNMIVIEEWMDKGQMPYFYIASDIILCPHRKLYEYSVSGVPNMAGLSKKPIVAPNFYFFSEIIKRFQIGVSYIPEDIKDMARAINFCFDNYDEIIRNAKFKESLKDYGNVYGGPINAMKKMGL